MIVNGECKKSYRLIKRHVEASMKKMNYVIKGVTIIDNTNVFHSADQSNLILCPTYSYKHPENYGALISQEVFNANMQAINATMQRYIEGYKPTEKFWRFQKQAAISYIRDINNIIPPKDPMYGILATFLRSHPGMFAAGTLRRYVSI
jgi:hypothetical protein